MPSVSAAVFGEDVYVLPASLSQQRIWFYSQLAPESPFYNIPLRFRLEGPLDSQILQRSIDDLAARHEILRTVVVSIDGQPRQVVRNTVLIELQLKDISHVPATDLEQELHRIATLEAQTPFDLATGPLFRCQLIRLSNREHELLVTVHHIIADGWSVGVFVRELSELYRAHSRELQPALATLPIQYADYAIWQNEWVSGAECNSQIDYWKRQLKGLPVLELLTDHPRPIARNFHGGHQLVTLNRQSSDALRELSANHGVTLFMTLLAAFQTLLYRYTDQQDIAVGSPIANRNREELEGLIGFFANTLVLRTELSAELQFEELLQRVKETTLAVYAHQDVPFDKLVDELQPDRTTNRNPLFQVVFALQNAPVDELDLGPVKLGRPVGPGRVAVFDSLALLAATRFDLELHLWDEPDCICGGFLFSTELFDAATIARMSEHFTHLLEGIIRDPSQRLCDLPLITKPERDQLLFEWNRTATEYPRDVPIHELFERQTLDEPSAIAVEHENESLTYAELNEQANALAHYLRRRLNRESADVLVGLVLKRSIDLIVAMLAVLKAGAAYVPLDPDYPQERLKFIIEDTGIDLLITNDDRGGTLGGSSLQTISLESEAQQIATESRENLTVDVTAESLAYVMYTSGSTGRPKGICVEHRAVVRLVKNTNYVVLDHDTVMLQYAPASFDASTFEIWGALLNAGKLVMFSPDNPSLADLGAEIKRRGITTMWLTAGLFHLMVDERLNDLTGVRQLLAGGDVLSLQHVNRFLKELPDCVLINGYGPTENTTFTCCHVMKGGSELRNTVPIGKPISNTRVYILDDRMRCVPVGVRGELYVGGDGVARAYLNRAQLTSECFIPDPFNGESSARLYRTGDLARYRLNGDIEFLGRKDNQVKIRGFRVEPAEVEWAIKESLLVSDCSVIVREDHPGEKRLIAYVVPAKNQVANTRIIGELRSDLRGRLPEYLVPTAFVLLVELPLSNNGKIDRDRFPVPDLRSELEAGYVAPQTEVERTIADIWKTTLQIEKVGRNDNFFDLGGHSLDVTQVHSKLTRALSSDLMIVDLFKYPTVESLAKHLSRRDEKTSFKRVRDRARKQKQNNAAEAIAIIGMVGRLPGASNLDQFWQDLCDGMESLTYFSDDQLIAAGVDPASLMDPGYVKVGTTLDGADLFDAAFFNYSPREAETMDPQHRVFLECSHQALEDAGYDPQTYDGLIGVYAGSTIGSYLNPNFASDVVTSVGRYPVLIGNDKDFVPTRVSYKLNLKGPSVNVQTACSTSLVAVHMACRSLLSAECDIALAGGVSIRFPQIEGYYYQEEGILSPDGHCRAFDAKAAGAIGGNGIGIVVLKRLSEALADGDTIHAVIRGTAINNDGSQKVGYTAPGVEGQARVIAAAQAIAGVDPAAISYVETHGTGTLLGDPIEIAALTQVFREATDKKQFCAIGSVKTNVGHCDAAAGVVGLIKVALSLKNRMLVPSINFEEPNPRIDFANSPFYVNTKFTEWRREETPLLAGLSSFGLGGTNAHAIVEEAPQRGPSGRSREWQLLSISARTEPALEIASANLKDYVREHAEIPLADVAFTSHVGRTAYPYRRTVLCQTSGEAATLLETLDPSRVMTSFTDSTNRPAVFMFPGGGAQYVNMGRDLYSAERRFRAEVDRCAELLKPLMNLDIRDVVYPEDSQIETSIKQLKRSSIALPILFTIEYATARLWIEWGVEPQAMIGHSLGEYTAACLAGVFSLEDALALVTERGRLMDTLPSGSMVSLALSQEEVLPYLTGSLSVAALNGPSLCVVSGAATEIETLTERLSRNGQEFRRIHIDVASHSGTVEPILEEFTRFVSGLTLHAPAIPYISNVTGTWITGAETTNPRYWANHLRQTVRFADGLSELTQDPQRVFLEIGPGQTLCSLVRQHPAKSPTHLVLSSMRHPHNEQSDLQFILNTLSQLWLGGSNINWQKFYQDERRHRVQLPTYPFERKQYWAGVDSQVQRDASTLSSVTRRTDIKDWFYAPVWKQLVVPRTALRQLEDETNWLMFEDDLGLGGELINAINERTTVNIECTIVRAGTEFARLANNVYSVNPAEQLDYERLLDELQAQERLPDRIIHLWTVSKEDKKKEFDVSDHQLEHRAFFSLLYLAQALGDLTVEKNFKIEIISSGLHRVHGVTRLEPEKATLLGPFKVIPQEYPHIATRSIDVVVPESGGWSTELINNLITEFELTVMDAPIAYRDGERWVQSFEPVPLDTVETIPNLRHEGVYLITGGLGGIALELAQHLADDYQAKLILVGRSEFPERNRWEELLSRDDEDLLSNKIRRVQRLEEAGAEVLIASADVCDPDAMNSVLETSLDRFGRINGVIHAAGLGGGGVIQLNTTEAASSVLAPKVTGTKVLAHLFRDAQLDFFVLCSSLVSFLGGTSHVNYCAANSFLDAFALSRRGSEQNVIAINWNVWRELGMARNQDLPDDFKEWRSEVHKFGVTPVEGVEMFRRILAAGLPQLAVSTQNLHALIAQKNVLMSGSMAEKQNELTRPAHARPNLTVSYVAPRSDDELMIAGMWQSLLGIEQIGVHDDFFLLGGHSLLGTRLISRLHDAFHVRIPLRRLFEMPTIAGLAQEVTRMRLEDDETEKKRVLDLLESLADDEIEGELSKRLH